MVEDHLRQTNALVDALDRDWHGARAAGNVPDRQWKNWAQWLAGWRKFYQDSQGFGATLSGGYVDRSQQYRLAYADWRERLRRLGAELASPAPTKERSSSPSWVRDIAIGLGIVGVSAVLGALIRGKLSR